MYYRRVMIYYDRDVDKQGCRWMTLHNYKIDKLSSKLLLNN